MNNTQSDSNECSNRIRGFKYGHYQVNTKRAVHISMFHRSKTISTETLRTAVNCRLWEVETRSKELLKKPSISYLC